jgi:hypothetical protein
MDTGARAATRAPLICLAVTVSTTVTAADPTPCQVLAEADVKAVLGTEWQPFTFLSKNEVCAYQAAGGRFVTLLLTHDPGGAEAILAGRRQMAGDKAKPAPGPGVGAYRLRTPKAIAVAFGKGEWVGQIDAAPPATTDPAILDRLAKLAYDRLP